MPSYEFRCLDCDHSFDVRRPFDRAGESAQCEQCDSPNTRRVYLPTATVQHRTSREESDAGAGAAAAIRIGGESSATLDDNTFIGMDIGLSVGGRAKVRGDRNVFRRTKTAIVAEDDADVKLGRVRID